jgi:cytochrome c oxidase subunit 4
MEDHGEMNPLLRLGLALAALLVLTVVTVAVSRVDLGALNIAVALTVAAAKTTIVLLYFMHLRQAGRAVTITFLTTVLILAAFIGFVFFDIAFR